MIQGAALELFWVVLVLGTPVLVAILWVKYKEYLEKRDLKVMIETRDLCLQVLKQTEEKVDVEREERMARFHARIIQMDRDDRIFKTVKEWRNDVA
jgi:hypothetical protein